MCGGLALLARGSHDARTKFFFPFRSHRPWLCLCLQSSLASLWDLELRLPSGLDRISLLSGLGLPTTVTVGLATSSDEFSFSMAMLAASYARLWTMELQKRIVSVASSRVRLLDFAPTIVESSEFTEVRDTINMQIQLSLCDPVQI